MSPRTALQGARAGAHNGPPIRHRQRPDSGPVSGARASALPIRLTLMYGGPANLGLLFPPCLLTQVPALVAMYQLGKAECVCHCFQLFTCRFFPTLSLPSVSAVIPRPPPPPPPFLPTPRRQWWEVVYNTLAKAKASGEGFRGLFEFPQHSSRRFSASLARGVACAAQTELC